ncbi:hypothetical protein [Campylobacter hyointestinalis]|uniref:hypothetical protein n=1 Tax=Campylobacter hyointestinalis TaxID=198 RepID=UPI000CE2F31B|nr:hypothetical protein [Campylobacter hyointestinalis]PPB61452.1 hypothetical protein CDQ74_08710 [Campylobacter hyointestinalis subsp. hyointestinalis]
MQSINELSQSDPLNLLGEIPKKDQPFADTIEAYVDNNGKDPLNLLSNENVDSDTKAYMETINTYAQKPKEPEPEPKRFIEQNYEGVPPSAMPDLEYDETGKVINFMDIKDIKHIEALYDQDMLSDEQVNHWVASLDLERSKGNFLDIKTDMNMDYLVSKGVFTKEQAKLRQDFNANPILYTAASAIRGGVRGVFTALDNTADMLDIGYNTLLGNEAEVKKINDYVKAKNTPVHKRTKEQQDLIDNTPSFTKIVGLEEAPTTTLGQVTNSISEFITGFAATRNLKIPSISNSLATSTNLYARAALSDYFAVNKGNENLSNVLADLSPELRGSVLTYLAYDKDDGLAEKALKNTAEGLGLGVLLDWLIYGVKMLKNTNLSIGGSELNNYNIQKIVLNSSKKDPSILDQSIDEVALAEGKVGYTKSKYDLLSELSAAQNKLEALNVRKKGNKANSPQSRYLQETIKTIKRDLKEGNFAPLNVAKTTPNDIVYKGGKGMDAFEAEFRAINKDEHNLELFESIINTARKLEVKVSMTNRVTKRAIGKYNANSNTIVINPKNRSFEDGLLPDDIKAKTMLHELIHSVSSRTILAFEKDGGTMLSATQKQGVSELKELYSILKNDKNVAKDIKYGLMNEHELLAELSEPTFRTYLKEKNLWEKIIDGVLKLLGFDAKGATKTDAYTKARAALSKIMDTYEPTMAKRELKAKELNALEATKRQEFFAKPLTKRIVTTTDFEKEVDAIIANEGKAMLKELDSSFKELEKEGNKAIRSNKHSTTLKKASKLIEDDFGIKVDFIKSVAKDTTQLASRVLAVRKIVKGFGVELKKEIDEFLANAEKSAGSKDKAEALELYVKLQQFGSMQTALKGISANVGRALNAHKIKVMGKEVDIESLSHYEVEQLLAQVGGYKQIKGALEEFAKRMADGDTAGAAGLGRSSIRFTIGNYLYANFLGGILSGYPTHLVNIGSSILNLGMHLTAQHMAIFGRAIAKRDLDELMQLTAAYKGLAAGIGDAFRYHKGIPEDRLGYFWRTFRDAESTMDFNVKIEHSTAKLTPSHFSKAGKEYWSKNTFAEHPIAWTAGYLADVMTSSLRLLQASDDAMKAIIYKSEVYRHTINHINSSELFKGASREERLKAFQDAVFDPTNIANNTQKVLGITKKGEFEALGIEASAIDTARAMTFTTPLNKVGINVEHLSPNPPLKKWGDTEHYFRDNAKIVYDDIKENYPKWIVGGVGAGLDKLAMSITDIKHLNNPLGLAVKYTIPFINTPLNIAKSFGRMTPLAILSREFQADLKAGGVRKWTALNKVALGSFMLWQTWELMDAGLVTGKTPKTLRGMHGMPPEHSIKIGDTWVSYARFDPFGMLLGVVVDLRQALDYNLAKEEEKQNAAGAVLTAFANTLVSKTYMTGLSDLMKGLSEEGVSEKKLTQTMAKNFVSSVLPLSSFFRSIFGDTRDVRETRPDKEGFSGFIEALGKQFNTIFAPTLNQPRLSIFGEPMLKPDKFLGVSYGYFTDDPAYLEMIAIGFNGKGISDTFSLNGTILDISPSQENEIRKIAGELGIKEAVTKLISSPGYMNLGGNEREKIELQKQQVLKVVHKYYEAAKGKWLEKQENMDKYAKKKAENIFEKLNGNPNKPKGYLNPAFFKAVNNINEERNK